MASDRPILTSATAARERSMDSRTVDVGQASGPIRRALIEGGSCSVEAEGRRRVLVHDPAVDAPLKRWPWPFPLFSPHRVRLMIYEGPMRVSMLTYGRREIERAIDYFLGGLPPNAKVAISRPRGGGGGA